MKKIICFICALIMALSAFGFAAFAEETLSVTFSDDFGTLTYGDVEYVIINGDIVQINDSVSYITVNLTEEQKTKISTLSITKYGEDIFMAASYKLHSGAYIKCTYINKTHFPIYEKSLKRENENVYLSMHYEQNDNLPLNLKKLMQTPTTFSFSGFEGIDDWYYVCSDFAYPGACMYLGMLIENDNKYYYLDFNAAGIEYNGDFYIYNLADTPISVFEVTDSAQLESIKKYISDYYGDDAIYDDDISSKVANVLLVIVFGVLPLAVLVAAIILGIKSKENYKKKFIVLVSITAVEIIVFTVLFATLLV